MAPHNNLLYAEFFEQDDGATYAGYLSDVRGTEAELETEEERFDYVYVEYHPTASQIIVHGFDRDYGIMAQCLAFSLMARSHKNYSEFSLGVLIHQRAIPVLHPHHLDRLITRLLER